jgi:glucose/mannose-6-phosphate isomerase
VNTSPAPAAAPHDPHNMLGAVRGLPGQLGDAWAAHRGLTLPATHRGPRVVVAAGMGGSAIGADLAAGLLAARLRAPVVVVRDCVLPAWVGPDTLVVATSHSGNTDETLAAFAAAGAAGARRVAITTGGTLAETARMNDIPLVTMPPGGQPRAAVGSSLAAMLAVLAAASVLPDPSADVAAAMTAMRDQVASEAAAARLVEALAGRLVLVWAPEGMAAVARRWKGQLNENAKVMASWDTLPELNHNTVEGLRDLAGHNRQRCVVLLSGADAEEPHARRVELTAAVLAGRGVRHEVIHAPTGPRLAQGLALVQLGDLASVLLAFHYGVDPTAVPELARLKAALTGAGPADAPNAAR